MSTIEEKYAVWCRRATDDPDLITELEAIRQQPDEIRERFYRELSFGTGGLRGIIGAGENRMNIYTVRKATQGLANYLLRKKALSGVAISYDSRIKSDLFAREAACVLAANGIPVHLFPQLEPTPVLSYAVRYFGCAAGIMVTASHNPSKYNGYKCYGADGCQMTDDDANAVTEHIRAVDIFDGVKTVPYDAALNDGRIRLIGPEVLDSFLGEVEKYQIYPGICREAGLKIVYTPLHGTGNLPVRAILDRIGAGQVTVVPEQELPDGNFPTAPYPNPEIREAFTCALALAEKTKPDLLLATDPDCDRVGIAVRRGDDYVLMTGNEVGCLLLEYVLSNRQKNGTLPRDPVAVSTIVTTPMAKPIAAKYGCELRETLTGFKYIGEQITRLEEQGEQERYVFGFEESYGYLIGGYVRDKDAVIASMLIVEMASYYRKQGKSLLDRMNELYEEYGFYRNGLINIAFEGEQGMKDMAALMERLRTAPPVAIAGKRVIACADYQRQIFTDLRTGEQKPLTLPRSNVLSFPLEGNACVIVRPSGTEPKVKSYITATGATADEAEALRRELTAATEKLLKE